MTLKDTIVSIKCIKLALCEVIVLQFKMISQTFGNNIDFMVLVI